MSLLSNLKVLCFEVSEDYSYDIIIDRSTHSSLDQFSYALYCIGVLITSMQRVANLESVSSEDL